MSKHSIYLHIGMPKTGTMSLRHYLSEHNGLLSERGFVYPDLVTEMRCAGRYHNSNFISKNINGLGVIVHFSNGRPFVVCKDYDYMFEIIDKYYETSDVIISEDELWCPQAIEIIKTISIRYKNVKIICYLRRQDLELESAYGELIRGGYQCGTFSEFKSNSWVNYTFLDYYSKLEHLCSIVGKENVTMRPFEREQLINANVIDDFMIGVLGYDLERIEDSCDYKDNEKSTKFGLKVANLYNDMYVSYAKRYPSIYKKLVSEMILQIPFKYVRAISGECNFPDFGRVSMIDVGVEEAKTSFMTEEEHIEMMKSLEEENLAIAHLFNRDKLFLNNEMHYEKYVSKVSDQDMAAIRYWLHQIALLQLDVEKKQRYLYERIMDKITNTYKKVKNGT